MPEFQPCLKKVLKQNSFVFEDFYQKIPFYLSSVADFECMIEIPLEMKIGEKMKGFMNEALLAGVWH